MVTLSIVVVCYSTRDMLRRCLAQLMPHVSRLAAEVVVVDNASADGSPDMVRERFPDVRLIANRENLGFARANNQAIQATESRYVALINSDAFPMNDAFDILLGVMESDPTIAAAGPRMHDGSGSLLATAHSFETLVKLAASLVPKRSVLPERLKRWGTRLLGRTGAQHMANYEAAAPTAVDWVSGACMVIRRSAIDRVGLLDERFFMYMEDEDWCRRFWQAGYRVVYVPEAKVTHLFARSSASVGAAARRYHSSRLAYHRKYNSRALPLYGGMVYLRLLGELTWARAGSGDGVAMQQPGGNAKTRVDRV